MNVIAFAPKYNKPGRHDATGAFQPEAQRFLEYHRQPLINSYFLFDNHASPYRMRRQVFAFIDNVSKDRAIDAIAFFCHGSRRGIQPGFDTSNLMDLASTLAACRMYRNGAKVILYACFAGGDVNKKATTGDGCFADRLRDALCTRGVIYCDVLAHSTKGDTDENPFVRRFEGNGSPVGGIGGYYIVTKGSEVWKKWIAALHTEFRWRYPFMTSADIVSCLSKMK